MSRLARTAAVEKDFLNQFWINCRCLPMRIKFGVRVAGFIRNVRLRLKLQKDSRNLTIEVVAALGKRAVQVRLHRRTLLVAHLPEPLELKKGRKRPQHPQ